MIEEPINVGNPWAAADSEALLKADKERPQIKISTIESLRAGTYYGLTHQMKEKYLIAFLKDGELKPRAGRFGTNDEGDDLPGVYFELTRRSDPKTFNWAPVELIVSYKLLDRDDYYINPSWDYGHYDMYSAAAAVTADRGRLAYYVGVYLSRTEQNEFVFTRPVSTEYLEKIVVKRGSRTGLIKQLTEAKVKLPPHWKNWEDNIAER